MKMIGLERRNVWSGGKGWGSFACLVRAWSGGEREEFIPTKYISKQDWQKKKRKYVKQAKKERGKKRRKREKKGSNKISQK